MSKQTPTGPDQSPNGTPRRCETVLQTDKFLEENLLELLEIQTVIKHFGKEIDIHR